MESASASHARGVLIFTDNPICVANLIYDRIKIIYIKKRTAVTINILNNNRYIFCENDELPIRTFFKYYDSNLYVYLKVNGYMFIAWNIVYFNSFYKYKLKWKYVLNIS